MLMVQDNKNFDAMADSEFSFEPITRVWFGIAPKVPKKIREDLVAVKKYLLDFSNKSTIELVFTGSVTVHRWRPLLDEKTGKRFLPMELTDLEEHCYSKDLDTVIRLTRIPGKISFGITHQLAPNIEVPGEARLILNLQFEMLHGKLRDLGHTVGKCYTKRVKALMQGYPISSGRSTFYQVDEAAIPVTTDKGETLGYIAHSIMIPLLQLGTVVKRTSPPNLPKLDKSNEDFLMGRIL